MKFRDRDSPVTNEGLIFRTYGYVHPRNACFCDLEYAKEALYKTNDLRAVRNGSRNKFYKFYFDKGLKFAFKHSYKVFNRPLNRYLVGIQEKQLKYVMKPQKRLKQLKKESDPLVDTVFEIVDLVTENSSLTSEDFGVFGSIAHGFHSPKYSDIDFVIYGIEEFKELRAALEVLYSGNKLRNEFESWTLQDPPLHWNFTNYSKKEYGSMQKRKLIYAMYDSKKLKRAIKVEFEPVRKWEEIDNDYDKIEKIENFGRVEAIVEILSDDESGFMPSIYPVKTHKVKKGINPKEVQRIVSYVEEFRLQLKVGDIALVH